MAGLRPTKAFADAALDLASVGAGERFFRIYPDRYPDPLGYGMGPSRFSDPRRRPDHGRFGVLYLGASLKVCFVEAVLRDRRNGAVGDYPIEETELAQFAYAEVCGCGLPEPRGFAPRRSDPYGRAERRCQCFRSALGAGLVRRVHEHPRTPDGVIYHSRLNQEVSLAIYDRAIGKLAALLVSPLLRAPDFPGVLNDLNVALA